jgi:hypothetical protein
VGSMRGSVSGRVLHVALDPPSVQPIHTATFTVTNTSDGGVGPLPQAIMDANGSTGPDTAPRASPSTRKSYSNTNRRLPTV